MDERSLASEDTEDILRRGIGLKVPTGIAKDEFDFVWQGLGFPGG